jgi:hypothetical protein
LPFTTNARPAAFALHPFTADIAYWHLARQRQTRWPGASVIGSRIWPSRGDLQPGATSAQARRASDDHRPEADVEALRPSTAARIKLAKPVEEPEVSWEGAGLGKGTERRSSGGASHADPWSRSYFIVEGWEISISNQRERGGQPDGGEGRGPSMGAAVDGGRWTYKNK